MFNKAFLTLILLFSAEFIWPTFVGNKPKLEPYYYRNDVVMVASSGRSGSSMLTEVIQRSGSIYKVIKTHFLPLDERFQGKTIFIFSNPDKAAESILHLVIGDKHFGQAHFNHMEGSDHNWLRKIGDTTQQTEEDNLLAYDAYGYHTQLEEWLYNRTEPCSPLQAEILAIKYENLWEPKTKEAIVSFLGVKQFKLPPQRPRGYQPLELNPKEALFRALYNLGTDENPRYAAYDASRILWKAAPPFQYLKRTRR